MRRLQDFIGGIPDELEVEEPEETAAGSGDRKVLNMTAMAKTSILAFMVLP
jgi:hypothetical protein